jgi:hypothetical protein
MQIDPGGTVQAASLSFPDFGISLAAPAGNLEGRLAIITAGEFTLPDMVFPELDVEITRFSRGAADASKAERSERLQFDDRFLDKLAGRLHIDLEVEFKIPWLGSRNATHQFRVGIDRGTLNFKQLESGLAGLENAFIDFEVKDGRLVLVRDIPLLPFSTKDLVYWELGDAGQAVAQENRVALRTLLHPVLPDKATASEEQASDDEEAKKKQPLQGVWAKNIDIELMLGASTIDLPKGGVIELGRGTVPAFSRLALSGEVSYEPEGEPHPTTLYGSGEDIALAIHDLPTGRGPFSCELEAREMERCTLTMNGFKPEKLTARFKGVALRGFRFAPPM